MSARRVKVAQEKKRYFLPIILLVILYIVTSLAVVLAVTPESYDVAPGEISQYTITASRNIEDTASTNLLIAEEQQKIQPIYKVDAEVARENIAKVENAFGAFELCRNAARLFYLTENPDARFDPARVDWATALDASDKTELKSIVPDYISEQDIYVIAAMTSDKLDALSSATLERIDNAQRTGIAADDVAVCVQNIRSGLVSTGNFSYEQSNLSEMVMQNNLKPNYIFDESATESAKAAAASSVKPIEYKMGQNIVRKGEIVTVAQFEIIKELGLTQDEARRAPRNIATFLLIALVFAVAFLYLILFDNSLLLSGKLSMAVFLISILTIGLTIAARYLDLRIFPGYLAAIVCAAMLKKRTALFFGVFITALCAFCLTPAENYLFGEDIAINIFAGALGCLAAVLVLRRQTHRGEYIVAGLLAGVMAALVYVAYGLTREQSPTDMMTAAGIGLLNGLVCGLLSVGILPIWESLFSLATPAKLLELANPGSSLLKKLMIEAPGTYHHSLMLANLAEAGCDAVGANSLLCRIASYYHDVGKLTNPIMFRENQRGISNPHDDMDPVESAKKIIYHVRAGVEIARDYNLPKQIVDIIAQHHGTTSTMFFLHKAKQMNMQIRESEFRYPGPKPQTKEAGILMLADTVEAAIRANNTFEDEHLLDQIKKLVDAKVADGQLDECPLNRREISRVILAFKEVLEGAHHERVIYPDDENESHGV